MLKFRLLVYPIVGSIMSLLLVYSIWLSAGNFQEHSRGEPNIASDREQFADFDQWLSAAELDQLSMQSVDEGISLARNRMYEMQDLIEQNPERALEMAYSQHTRAAMPEQIQPFIEEAFSEKADVYVSVICGQESAQYETFTKLKSGIGFRAFTTPGNRYNRTRKDLHVEGIRLGDVGALKNFIEAEPELQKTGAAPSSATVWNMYVVLIDFSDWNASFLENATIENDINTTVTQQISDMSSNGLSVNCTVHPGVFRMPRTIEQYRQTYTMLSAMMQAIHEDITDPVNGIGVDVSSYDTVCVVSKSHPSLTFGGYAEIAGSKMWVQVYNPGYTPTLTIAHELGHNFGSYHAHFWNAPGTDPVEEEPGVLPPSESYHVEYGDFTDIMGSGLIPQGHFHVQNKHQVGWLGAEQITDVTDSGTYRLYRSDHPDSTGPVQAVQIEKAYNTDFGAYEYYWLGYRQLYPDYENFGRGLYVLWQKPNVHNYPKSYLLDMTLGSAGGKFDGGLCLGKTYSDTVAGIHITPVSRGGCHPDEYMDVVINFGPYPGNTNPTASISTSGTLSSEESLTISVTATDAEEEDLAYFWDFGDGRVYPNEPIVQHVFSGSGSTTVKCTVSDMKGGIITTEKTFDLSHPLDNWTSLTPVGSADILDVTYGEGKFVAVGTMGTVARSTDGETWTVDSVGGDDAALVILEKVIYDGSKFVVVGNQPNTDYTDFWGTIYTSDDAVTWTQRYVSNSDSLQLRDVGYNSSSTYLAVGINGKYVHSNNGLAWTAYQRLDGDGFALDADQVGIEFINGAFPVVGTTAPGTLDDPLLSITFTGSSWTNRDIYADAPGGISTLKVLNGKVFSSGPWFGINHSTNRGYTFSNVYNGSYLITAFAYGNGVYFAAGEDASGNDMNLVSSDGISWHELTTVPQENRNAAFFHNNRFYTLGNSGVLYKSDPVSGDDAGWAKWQRARSVELGINRDPEENADCDAAKNLLEYALGTIPGDPTSFPMISSAQDGTGHLVIYISRTREAPDLNYIVEQSTDLGASAVWSAVETDPVSESDTEIVYRTLNPVSSVSPQFLRLRVEVAAPAQ